MTSSIDAESTIRRHFTTNYFRALDGHNVTEVLALEHLLGYVLAELLDLLSDVFEECFTRPSALHHDSVDGAVS